VSASLIRNHKLALDHTPVVTKKHLYYAHLLQWNIADIGLENDAKSLLIANGTYFIYPDGNLLSVRTFLRCSSK
jgi:hypothetical protein